MADFIAHVYSSIEYVNPGAGYGLAGNTMLLRIPV